MATTRTPVLFLAGIGRSGTTLLERTLAEADSVVALGEVMHLWQRNLIDDERCGCGLAFHSCPFWTEVGQRAFGGWNRVDPERMGALKASVDRAMLVPFIARGWPRRLAHEVEEYVGHYRRLYDAARAVSGASVVIDSSKQVSLAWCLSTAPELDLRVLHCVRDLRGVSYSWQKQVRRPEATRGESEWMPRYSPTTISALWNLHNREIEALGSRVPIRRVRYESFVRNPGAEVTSILGFAGLTPRFDHIHGSTITLTSHHTCAGNPMRFRTGEVEVIVDEQWRRQQTGRLDRALTTLSRPLLKRYGYR